MKGMSSSPVTERHMTEGLRHFVPIESDEGLERSAVAGAAAVEKLIADRNNLRNLLATHERELAASRAAQEDLKRQLGYSINGTSNSERESSLNYSSSTAPCARL